MLTASLKTNVVANYLGQGWRALMALAFVPTWISILGIEAYGLVGIFLVLQAWLGLLDMGLRPTLSREMSRYLGGEHDAQSIRDLLRSIEIIAAPIAILILVVVWAASGWLSTHWVRPNALAPATIAGAVVLMGVVIALQLPETLYASALTGLQRQVLLNALSSLMATMRAGGTLVVLLWVSPTITAFFAWQCVISLVSAGLTAAVLYARLPAAPRRPRFSLTALTAIRDYAGGMVAITLLSLLLLQVDKILLSRQLGLEGFGLYSLAAVVAGSITLLSIPIGAALLPRLTELASRGDEERLRITYHQAAQLTSAILGPAAAMLIVFADRILLLWTGDPAMTKAVSLLVALLTAGYLLNGIMTAPYLLQLAHGWTSLSLKINCVAVALLVPMLFWVVPRYGAVGAAVLWLGLNVGFVLIGAQFMFRRLIPTERWSWYRNDIGIPLATAFGAAVLFRALLPTGLSRLVDAFALVLIGCVVMAATVLSCPLMRSEVRSFLRLGTRAEATQRRDLSP